MSTSANSNNNAQQQQVGGSSRQQQQQVAPPLPPAPLSPQQGAPKMLHAVKALPLMGDVHPIGNNSQGMPVVEGHEVHHTAATAPLSK